MPPPTQQRIVSANIRVDSGNTLYNWVGFGIASVVRNGQGDFRLTFQNPRAAPDFIYSATAMPDESNPGNNANANVNPDPAGAFVDVAIQSVVGVASDDGFTFTAEPLAATGAFQVTVP